MKTPDIPQFSRQIFLMLPMFPQNYSCMTRRFFSNQRYFGREADDYEGQMEYKQK